MIEKRDGIVKGKVVEIKAIGWDCVSPKAFVISTVVIARP